MKKNNQAGATCCRKARIAAILSIIGAVPFIPALAAAQAADVPAAETTDPVDIEVFQGVRVVSGPGSNAYPKGEVYSGREGWVTLNMMISPKGTPYEVMVLESSGNPALEKAALKAVKQVGFSPARRGKTPIDSSYTLKLKFAIDNLGKGASRKFISTYQKLINAVTARDKATADTLLPQLNADNLYEEAFSHYARYFYFRTWGTPAEQYRELSLAIAGEKRPEYLPKDVFVSALVAMFALEVQSRAYGSALATWEILEPLAPKDQREAIVRVVNEIKALQSSERPIDYPASIGPNLSWNGQLFRNRFSIHVTSGAVSEIKLRCQKKYLFFPFKPGVEYSIGGQKDQCGIEVIGDPGTAFVLAQ